MKAKPHAPNNTGFNTLTARQVNNASVNTTLLFMVTYFTEYLVFDILQRFCISYKALPIQKS